MKLFSEIYSTYYSITEKILKKRTVTKAEIADIIRQNGFSESVLFLEPKLTGEDGYGLLKKRRQRIQVYPEKRASYSADGT